MTESVAQRDPVEQLAEEFMARLRRGEHPALSEYTTAHPDLADEIRDLFPALVMMEQIKPAGTEPHAPTADTMPEQLGDYRILREVARGGMGVVYEAEQVALGRHVALKVLPAQTDGSPLRLLRFRREARSAARLHHTNIVPVFDVGSADGVHYYAMQFIQGQGLDEVLQELRRLRSGEKPTALPADDLTASLADGLRTGVFAGAPIVPVPKPTAPQSEASAILTGPAAHYIRSVAHLGVQAADALAYAHGQRVLHRDVKPSNLLLDRQGTLWLTDFGLAKDDTEDLTRTGDIIGTIRYMAPERFQGVSDPRTDVYALGVTLYEMLTLRPAFPEQDRVLLITQIAKDDPPKPRTIDPTLPRDLETIVLKAIEKEPARRYPTAAEMADDLRRFLADRPIKARRASWREQAWRWCRRNPSVAASLSVAFALLVLLVAGLSVGTVLVWKAKRDVETAKGEVETALAEEKLSAYFQRIALADRELAANDLARADELLAQCPPDLRGWEWHYLTRRRGRTLPPMSHPGVISGRASVSPDGRRVAVAGPGNAVTVWDAVAGREILPPPRPCDRTCSWVAFGPDGRYLASADATADRAKGDVVIRDAATLREVRRWAPPTGAVIGMAFDPAGRRLACSYGRDSTRNDVGVWDVATGVLEVSLPAHNESVQGVAFSPDGRLVATAGNDRVVRVSDSRTGAAVHTFATEHYTWCVAFSPDGRRLAAGYGDYDLGASGVRVWDLGTGAERHALPGPAAFAVAFSPDGRRIVCGGIDGTVKIWAEEEGREVLTLRGHTDIVRTLAFTPDGHRLVSAAEDRSVRIWDARPWGDGDRTGDDDATLSGHHNSVVGLEATPDGSGLVTVSADGEVKVWDVPARRERWSVRPRGFDEACAVALSPNGGRIAASGRLKTADGRQADAVAILDAATGAEVGRLEGFNGPRYAVAFGPGGRLLAAAGDDGLVTVHDPETRAEVWRLAGHNGRVMGVAFDPAPGGTRLASAGADQTVRLWDVTTGRPAGPPLAHPGVVNGVAFSPDGRFLATGGQDKVIRVWDTRTGAVAEQWVDQTGATLAVAFGPDGRLLAWAGTDSTVKVWRRGTGEVVTLRGHRNWVLDVAFSPDGTWIGSGGRDASAKLWPNSFLKK